MLSPPHSRPTSSQFTCPPVTGLQVSPFIRQDRIPVFLTMKDMKGQRTKIFKLFMVPFVRSLLCANVTVQAGGALWRR